MSAKTPIIVLHMKEVIYTVIFAGLALLLLVLLFTMFLPKKGEAEATETMKYTPGVYTSSIQFSNRALDVQVIVDESKIHSISLINLDESVAAMYPLMEPALENLSTQIIKNQSLENITYDKSNQYTSILLLNAIDCALKKAVRIN